MKALMYLTKRSFINNMKKAVRKPTTLLLIVFLTGYGIFITWTLAMLAKEMHFDSPQGLVVIVTLWTLYIFLADSSCLCIQKGRHLPAGAYAFCVHGADRSEAGASSQCMDELHHIGCSGSTFCVSRSDCVWNRMVEDVAVFRSRHIIGDCV